MPKLVNRAKMTTATTGTGTITLGSAVDGYQTFAAAGVADADVVRYVIEDGDAWEIGLGTYTASGTTLTRGSIESSNADNPINLSGTALVFLTVAGGDLQHAADMNQGVATTDSPTFAGLTATTADINGGTIDGTTIGGSTPAAGTFSSVTVNGNITVTGTVDGRDVAADGSKLDGIEANAKDDQTINAGAGLTGGGTGDVTISHADTSAQASVNNSGATVIQDVTLDTYGHITALGSATITPALIGAATSAQGTLADSATQPGDNISTLTNDAGYTTNIGDITGVTAGSGLTGGGTSGAVTVSHADTSTQASVDNSGATVIQDVTLDTYGHVTGLGSATLGLSDFGVTASATELNYTDGVTSNIQSQLNGKASNATQAQATWEDATSTMETIVSPAKIKAAIDANAALGFNPAAEWTDVLSSRAVSTAYQNTTGFVIQIHIESGSDDQTNPVDISTDGTNWVQIDNINSYQSLTMNIMPGHYYRIRSDSIADIGRWLELR